MLIKFKILKISKLIPADIVIYDEVNSEYVSRVLNAKYKIFTLNVRDKIIYLNYKIILKFLLSLKKIDYRKIKICKQGLIIGVLRQLRRVYLYAYLTTVKPKAVITMIDNSNDFHWLSKNLRSFPFIAIQNGSRLSYCSTDHKEFYLQHFFCFGAYEIVQFKRIGYNVENFYPVGSLIADLHFKQELSHNKKFDLLIISSWRGNIGLTQEFWDTMESMMAMDELLAKFLANRKLKAAVILRSERNSEHWYIPALGLTEVDYFKNIYGSTVEIIDTNFKQRNIYQILQQSELLISCLSTSLLEGFGIGKKALYCNFTSTDLYHQDFDKSMVIVNKNYASFSKKIDQAISLPFNEYFPNSKKLQERYMSFPATSSTKCFIMNKIDLIIENNEPRTKK